MRVDLQMAAVQVDAQLLGAGARAVALRDGLQWSERLSKEASSVLDSYTARLADLQLAVAPVTQRTQVDFWPDCTSRGQHRHWVDSAAVLSTLCCACRPCRRLGQTLKRRESGRRKCSAMSTQHGRHALRPSS